MFACFQHGEKDDPDPKRTRGAAPEAQGAGGAGGDVIVGLSVAGDSPGGGAADRRGDVRPTPAAAAGRATRQCRSDGSGGPRQPVIVLDASAVIELLLNSPAGRRVASRIVERAPFHAPHLLDLEVASAFRRQAAAGHVTA